ncbi:hypothetical protein [Desulfitobacterium hafniense]|uniref:Uncharacterized protein n=1 Tax=Desulfitobacterium hafniense (strain Y51) TaxID=138119 RepID=Q24NP6_DESHY|nr:hypothetical protein [Desulfitobacterium hafniense]BAE86346.1 hypothetical protein DSY4557 [Desulfitobacterium hafniense Y51]
MTNGKLCAILKDKKGTSFPLIIAVALVLVLIFCGISEYIRLVIIAQGVRDVVQSAVISTVNDSYDDVYHGVREGYAGAYRPSAADFEESLDYGDIYGRMDELLGLQASGGYHVKYAGDAMEFRVSELTVDLNNMPLAPGSPDNSNGFLADAMIRLEVPVRFGGRILPAMDIRLKVQAKYMPLF